MPDLTQLPVIPQTVRKWTVGDYSATFELEDGSHMVVSLAVYRIWESGFIKAAALTRSNKDDRHEALLSQGEQNHE